MENFSVEEKKEVSQKPTFKNLLRFKLHYFMFMSGGSAIYPYIFIYAKQLGITADVVGYITAFIWCITVLSRPIIGGLADHFNKKFKLVLMFLVGISISTGLGLSFIPQPPQENSSNSTFNSSVICHRNNSYLVELETNIRGKCFPLSCILCEVDSSDCKNANFSLSEQMERISSMCNQDLVIRCLDGAVEKNCNIVAGNNATSIKSFVSQNGILQVSLFCIFATMFLISQTSLDSLTDATCAKNLGDKLENFGKQRMWGAIGWAIFSFVAGTLNYAFSESDYVINYIPGFYLSIAFYALDIFMIWKLQLEVPKSVKSIFKNVAWLLLKPRVLIFLLEVVSEGLLRGVFMTFSLWYLKTIGATPLLLGSVTSAQCFLGEIPFLFFSGWIIRKIGHLNVFTMSFFAHSLRFFAYTFLVNPWYVLFIEVLQGPTFGSFHAGMTTYGKLLAPPGAEATMQGIAMAVMDGVGTSAGTLIGGYWIHYAGGRETFFQAGVWAIAFGIMSAILNGFIMCNLIK